MPVARRRAEQYERVAVLRSRPVVVGHRKESTVGAHEEEQVVAVRDGARRRPDHDLGLVLVPPAHGGPREGAAEERLAPCVRGDHPVLVARRRGSVDHPVDAAFQRRRGERGEVVLRRQEEHRRDTFHLGTATGRGRERLARREPETGSADPVAFLLDARPHEDVEAGLLQRQPEIHHPAAADQQRPGAGGPDDAEDPGHGRRGQPVDQHGHDDHQEGDREDLVGTRDSPGDQGRRERRRRRGGHDAPRVRPADEATLGSGQAGTQRRGQRHQGTDHQHDHSHRPE
jgi:hypothetical protein